MATPAPKTDGQTSVQANIQHELENLVYSVKVLEKTVAIQNERLDKLTAMTERVVEGYGRQEKTLLNLFRTMFSSNETDLPYEETMKRMTDQLCSLAQIKKAMGYVNKAKVQLHNKKYSEALHTYDEARKLLNNTLQTTKIFGMGLPFGMLYDSTMQKLLDCALRILKDDPSQLDQITEYAREYYEFYQQQMIEGDAPFEVSNYYNVMNMLGLCYLMQGKHQEAHKLLELRVQAEPSNVYSLFAMGQCNEKFQNIAIAIDFYQQVKELVMRDELGKAFDFFESPYSKSELFDQLCFKHFFGPIQSSSNENLETAQKVVQTAIDNCEDPKDLS